MVRKIFSVLFILVFMPLFVVVFILFMVRYSLFNANYYKSALEKTGLYNSILDKGLNYALEGMSKGNVKSGVPSIFSNDSLKDIIKKTIAPEWLKKYTELIIDQSIAYIMNDSQKVEIIIPTSEIKKSLTDNATQYLDKTFANLPECTAEQLKKLEQQSGSESFNIDCKPKGASTLELNQQMMGSLNELINSLPENYNLGEKMMQGPYMAKTRDSIRQFKMFSNIGLIVLGIILFIIALINIQHFSSMLKFIFIPVLIVTLFIFPASFVGYFLLKSFASGFFVTLPNELKSVPDSLVSALFKGLFTNAGVFSGILVLFSIILLIVAYKMGKRKTEIVTK